jgi:putative Holliday junction resolvase
VTVLGIDPGEKRVGVAAADLETRFARPVEVIDATQTDVVARILELVAELAAIRIVVGKPVGLTGREGPAVDKQKEFLERLRGATDVEIAEFDERLTTVVAEAGLLRSGANRKSRKALRDAVAAQVMLQGYMDSTR